MTDARTLAGMSATTDLLDALHRNDVTTAEAVLNNADPEPTMFCLASAWLALAETQELDTGELLDKMRATVQAQSEGPTR